MKKVSVIVISHNAENSVGKVLSALKSQDYGNYEVIAVDDNSQDGTVGEITSWMAHWKDLRLLRNETNLGLAKSMNIGIRNSSGEIIITLHDDCVLLSDTWISDMVKVFDIDSRIAIVSSRFLIRFKELSLWEKCFSFAYFLGDDISLQSCHPSREDIDMISDKCDGYLRTVLNEVGLFDESFRIGGEDADLSARVKKAGYRIVRNNACRVEHIFNQSHREDSILNHFKKAFKSTEDAVYVLQRYGMWYKFDSFLVILLWILGLIANQFGIAFIIGLSYLLAKNFVKALRYYRRYGKLDLVIPIWLFCTIWDVLAGLGWVVGILSVIPTRVNKALQSPYYPTLGERE